MSYTDQNSYIEQKTVYESTLEYSYSFDFRVESKEELLVQFRKIDDGSYENLIWNDIPNSTIKPKSGFSTFKNGGLITIFGNQITGLEDGDEIVIRVSMKRNLEQEFVANEQRLNQRALENQLDRIVSQMTKQSDGLSNCITSVDPFEISDKENRKGKVVAFDDDGNIYLAVAYKDIIDTKQFRDEAETFANNANSSATDANNSATSAYNSAMGAFNSENNATTSANASATSANSANTSAVSASDSASTATIKAKEASDSANSASTSATTATIKAEEASDSANSSAFNATSASSSAINSLNSANTAVASADTAVNSANTAVASADIATEKASQSITSATNANIWAEGTDEQVQALGGIHSSKGWAEESASGQLNSDWNETDSTSKAFIKNKPDIYTKTESDSRYAPLALSEPLYFNVTSASTADLLTTKPTISATNYLEFTKASTAKTLVATITRTVASEITLTSVAGFDVDLYIATNVGATPTFSYVIEDENGVALSTEQSQGSIFLNGTSFNDVRDIPLMLLKMDLIEGSKTFAVGDKIVTKVYQKQLNTSSKTYRIYCGATIDGADYYSGARFNFSSIDIDTSQIIDGAVTYPKLSSDVQEKLASLDYNGIFQVVSSGTTITISEKPTIFELSSTITDSLSLTFDLSACVRPTDYSFNEIRFKKTGETSLTFTSNIGIVVNKDIDSETSEAGNYSLYLDIRHDLATSSKVLLLNFVRVYDIQI